MDFLLADNRPLSLIFQDEESEKHFVSIDIEIEVYKHFYNKNYLFLSETIFTKSFFVATKLQLSTLEDEVFYYVKKRQGMFALLGASLFSVKKRGPSPISKIPRDILRVLMGFLPEKKYA